MLFHQESQESRDSITANPPEPRPTYTLAFSSSVLDQSFGEFGVGEEAKRVSASSR